MKATNNYEHHNFKVKGQWVADHNQLPAQR